MENGFGQEWWRDVAIDGSSVQGLLKIIFRLLNSIIGLAKKNLFSCFLYNGSSSA